MSVSLSSTIPPRLDNWRIPGLTDTNAPALAASTAQELSRRGLAIVSRHERGDENLLIQGATLAFSGSDRAQLCVMSRLHEQLRESRMCCIRRPCRKHELVATRHIDDAGRGDSIGWKILGKLSRSSSKRSPCQRAIAVSFHVTYPVPAAVTKQFNRRLPSTLQSGEEPGVASIRRTWEITDSSSRARELISVARGVSLGTKRGARSWSSNSAAVTSADWWNARTSTLSITVFAIAATVMPWCCAMYALITTCPAPCGTRLGVKSMAS